MFFQFAMTSYTIFYYKNVVDLKAGERERNSISKLFSWLCNFFVIEQINIRNSKP